MQDDVQALTEKNTKISSAENDGDCEWLAKILAPRLAFQRANDKQTIDDQVAFLQQVEPGGNRTTRKIESIDVHGNRAIVKCIIAVGDQDVHNIRLFVRREGGWKLLAWANERL